MNPKESKTSMSLGDHLEDLRGCFVQSFLLLAVSVLVAACFFGQIVDFLTHPIHTAFHEVGIEPQLVSGLMNTFFTIVKAVFIAALVVASPFIIKQIWTFIKPGLKAKEVKALRPVLIFGSFFFLLGASFAYLVVAPLGMAWLLNLNQELDITSLISISESIDFLINIMLVFGIAFETPLIIMGLVRSDIVDINTLKNARRYVVLAAFVLAALFTPPDVMTQVLLAGALILLYELGIFLARIGFTPKK